ncbi:ATP-dependent helicase HrpB [Immundisolibacter cernigliae]|uniref:ATP-dependent helicase HrpB n=1 Tax=Immundisolibacter cernigliae TaxID=1810504 RepID=A0A1B1YTQ7_9GAMM|nr:ATP-dependent helicase HrpB [Immundisolibacter cernigliae]ANX04043.1 ATP-dependent helicase HrpB [Immundisolibacter cernigliae]
MSGPELPIDEALPALRAALDDHPAVVLEAPPGAGKTTRVPLDLLAAPWLGDQKILLLEPRRLAARAAARRMASLLGEAEGQTVGYRTRLDSRVSAATRIEVITEGILTRLLQADPALTGVGLVIFDEFHERSLQADLGLALCLQAQALLRPDLRLLVMSATLDGAAVAQLLGGAPRVSSAGRSFPVSVRHLPGDGPLEGRIVAAIRRALAEETGSLLVFLPGTPEIRRLAAQLERAELPADVRVCPLYAGLDAAAQDAAIAAPPPGERKIVLATRIAESSLTIDGIGVVIDAGLSRHTRFNPRTGMDGLVTVPVSRAAAEQRAGRAGRLGPGVCFRLWSEAEHSRLPAYAAPEIAVADLAPLALELALWGVRDPAELAWLTPPPAPHLAQARQLLQALGALDASAAITPHGRALAGLGLPPRLAHLLLAGASADACLLAALLAERDVLRRTPGQAPAVDIELRLTALRTGRAGGDADRAAFDAVLRLARRLQSRLPAGAGVSQSCGALLALAFPDRIAQRRSRGSYRLANGRGATLDAADALAGAEFLVVAELDDIGDNARIRLAAGIERSEIEAVCGPLLETVEQVRFDAASGAVQARRVQRLGALVLADDPLPQPSAAAIAGALLEAIARRGVAALPWSDADRQLRARVALMVRLEPEAGWPDLSDAALQAGLADWLRPYLPGLRRMDDLADGGLRMALSGLLDHAQARHLDAELPRELTVNGRARAIDYAADTPVLAVRLQDLFGQHDTPRLAGGRLPLVLHLLSPAGRPVAVTADLGGFWRGAYAEVRKQMRGRYPKHPWPDDPLAAAPPAPRR